MNELSYELLLSFLISQAYYTDWWKDIKQTHRQTHHTGHRPSILSQINIPYSMIYSKASFLPKLLPDRGVPSPSPKERTSPLSLNTNRRPPSHKNNVMKSKANVAAKRNSRFGPSSSNILLPDDENLRQDSPPFCALFAYKY